MALALTQQPVSICLDCARRVFQHYSSGVIKRGCGTSLDHCVLAVGYTDDAYIIKNSWGETWGENGYLRVAKHNENGPGVCGVLEVPAYPTYQNEQDAIPAAI